MRLPRLRVALALAMAWFAGLASARFVIEQGGLKITFPPEAKTKYPGGFDMALANFGAPKYGGALMGRLIYIDKEYGQDYTCSPPCRFACQDFAAATPKLDLRSGGAAAENYIMLVDRGPTDPGATACRFAEKVWNAQQAGAKGVVVANFEDKMTTMEAPDEDDEGNYKYLANITIPATFVTRSSGEALKALLRAAAGGGPSAAVYVSLDWTDALPRQKQVEWEFWTNSNDQCGPVCDVQAEFIKAFVPVAKEFDGAGWTRFTPHYIVWTCPNAYRDSAECRSQCTHRGRYCAPDPDGSIKEGYSGAEVVEENLRQLCVHRLANATGRPWLWWDYATAFSERCAMDVQKYGQPCAEEVFESLNAEKWSSLEELRRCIGGKDDDTPHAIMEEQLKAQAGDGSEGEVFILPTLRINGAQYRGKLAVGEVLRALCAGFEEGNRPGACDRAVDDACMVGAKGYAACAGRGDGKTACVPSFSGYTCVCGQGFISHKAPNGTEACLDINECLSISQLDPKCTCPRCACKNTYGGYECVDNVPDECAADHGGCWHTSATVKGKRVEFSACHDNMAAYRDALARGLPPEAIPPLHNCTCPPCFSPVERRGKVSCEPRCNLDYCDLEYGVCHAEPGGGGVGAGTVAAIVVAVLAAVGVGGFAAYKLYMRGLMQAEVRSIMAQYMPLGDAEPGEGRGLLPTANGRGSAAGV